MNYVKYDYGFMFAYSERPGTMAAKKIKDDIPGEVKKKRLQEIISLQREHSEYRTKQFLGKNVTVLIEKTRKKSDNFEWKNNPKYRRCVSKENYNVGDFVDVLIENCTSATLIGSAIDYSNGL